MIIFMLYHKRYIKVIKGYMENNPKNYWDYDSDDKIRVDNRFEDNRKLFNYFFTDVVEIFLKYIWGMTRKDIKNY